ncbi:outer membrane protein assembly factor BamB family protein [Citreicoccus inhibens]|uniref:outer membrane protein assembly factor BamB family protein n=1 Tax=Citreicoccus inhibens TaxID=2849499 RepID=UPI002E28DFDC|nr:PQQ-binding-like beta-propeller repeat protein [Citreicoccus inhibens]
MACQQPAEPVFRASTDASSRAGLLPVEDGVIAANEAGAVVRLDRAGAVRWRVALGREVATRPVLAQDSVIVGTVSGDVVRLALADGAERWRLTGEPPVLTAPATDEAGSTVYLVAPDGAVRALAVETGQLRWRIPAPKAEEARLDPTRGLPAPVMAEGRLLLALGDAGLVALSAQDGAVRWKQPLTGVLGLEVEPGGLYVSTRAGQVVALSLRDGSTRWTRQVAESLTGPPTRLLSTVWVGAGPAQLVGMAPSDGHEVARVALPAPLVTQVGTAFGTLLLVPTNDREGRLVVLKAPAWDVALSLRTDTALRTRPVVQGAQVFQLGQDGRVLSWKLRVPEP